MSIGEFDVDTQEWLESDKDCLVLKLTSSFKTGKVLKAPSSSISKDSNSIFPSSLTAKLKTHFQHENQDHTVEFAILTEAFLKLYNLIFSGLFAHIDSNESVNRRTHAQVPFVEEELIDFRVSIVNFDELRFEK